MSAATIMGDAALSVAPNDRGPLAAASAAAGWKLWSATSPEYGRPKVTKGGSGMAQAPVAIAGMTWEALIDRLLDDVELVLDRTLPRFLALPSYEGVDALELRAGTRTNTLIVLSNVREMRTPDEADPETLAAFTAIGDARARQGIRAADMAQGWRIGVSQLQQRAKELLHDVEGGDRLQLLLFETTLPWSDAGMMTSVEAHRRTELEMARQEHHARANLVRDLLFGDVPGPQVRARAEVFGLDVTQTYHAVRARPHELDGPRSLERYLGTWDTGHRRHGLVALVDGDLCGFVRALPPGEPPAAIGVSEAVGLSDLAAAFRRASRALETALGLGVSSVCDMASLGLHPAIAADDDVGRALMRRYIAPLEALGASGRMMLETVERYIENDRRLEVTAAELHVHANTVRYRIGRFEELTSCSLRHHVALIETWWALQRRALERRAADAG